MEKGKNFAKTALYLLITAVLCIAIVSVANRIVSPGKPDISHEVSEGSLCIVYSAPDSIPDYSGEDYVVLNNNIPNFNEWDINNITGEHFSELDSLGRCGCAYALLHRSMMPTGPIGSATASERGSSPVAPAPASTDRKPGMIVW